MNKIQGYLNALGRVKRENTEDFKLFIDRFKKLIGDVRAIDAEQVPTDINLMGILKESVSSELVLWGLLTFTKDITLEDMMNTVAKWKTKPTVHSSDSAVANYSGPGNLKKAYGKKQNSRVFKFTWPRKTRK